MNVSFQHANQGKTSTLLRFKPDLSNQTFCLLIDSGPGVDVDELLSEDEYLTGILLTHLHRDHYATLDDNLQDGANIYTSRHNAGALSTILGDANVHREKTINLSKVEEALTPIEGSTTIGGCLTITPVPAGHTPGATAFHIEFETENGESEDILITGDFTRRPVAGYPGLELRNADTLILTGATSDSFEESATEALDETLKRSTAGSNALVTATGTNCLHFAYLLGHTLAKCEEESQIAIAGQAAKIYDVFNYDIPNVTAVPEYSNRNLFDDFQTVITGPQQPTVGGAKKLFNEIKNNPNDILIQLVNEDKINIGGCRCTVKDYSFINHPTDETIQETVEILDPKQVIVTHQTGSDLKRYRDDFNRIVWAPSDSRPHTVYENSEPTIPDWMDDDVAEGLNGTPQRVKVESPTPEPLTDLQPTTSEQPAELFKRQSPDIEAEGVNTNQIVLLASQRRPSTECKYSSQDAPTVEGPGTNESIEENQDDAIKGTVVHTDQNTIVIDTENADQALTPGEAVKLIEGES